MAFLEASAQYPVAPSLEWGTGNIKLGGKEDLGGGNAPGELQRCITPLTSLLLCMTIFFFFFHLGQRQTTTIGMEPPAWELGVFAT